MKSIRRKIVSLINLGSNKVYVVSLTIFFIFLKLSKLNIIFENKKKKEKKMQITKISSIL